MTQIDPRNEEGLPESSSRRGFFSVAAAGLAGVAIAPGIRLIEVAHAGAPQAAGVPVTQGSTAGADPRVRWGLLIDTTRCASGCTDCVDACNTEHGLEPTPSPTTVQWIRKVEIREARSGRTASVPVMCQHCANPPCCDVCPTQASFKRADGIVLVDRHTCIGCRYCMMACPFNARSFVREPVTHQRPDMPRGKGCVESCTLCVHRIDAGQTDTACAEACTKAGHEAITFGDLNDPESAISRRIREVPTVQLRADLRLDHGVRYKGLGT